MRGFSKGSEIDEPYVGQWHFVVRLDDGARL
jgi:hypothetical protein